MDFGSFYGGSMYSDGNKTVQYADKDHRQDKENARGCQEPPRDRRVLERAHGGLLDRAVLRVLDFDHTVLVGDWNGGTHRHNPHTDDHARRARETGHLLRLHWETDGDVSLHGESRDRQYGSVGGDLADEGAHHTQRLPEHPGVQRPDGV